MFRNLLALLFLFALALPALAVPAPVQNGAAAMTEDCHGVPTKHEGKAPVDEHVMQHGCIGCIGCIAPYVPALELAGDATFVSPPLPAPMPVLSEYTPKPRDPPPRTEA